ncbi:MAG TPA: hypothetical protein VHC22_19325 [Pirellulales bacterium]|nr:hypothetical protein [Pirellulales bacterium]
MWDVAQTMAIAIAVAMVDVGLIGKHIVPAYFAAAVICLSIVVPLSFLVCKISKREQNKAAQRDSDAQPQTISRNLLLLFLGCVILMMTILLYLPRNALIVIGVCLVCRYYYQLYRRSRYATSTTKQQVPKGLSDIMNNPQVTLVCIGAITGVIIGRHLVTTDTNLALCNDVTHPDAAVTACTTLINSGNAQPVVFMKRGVAYLNTNRLDQAMADMNRSLSVNPRYVQSLALRGTISLIQGQTGDALRDFDHALQINTLRDTKFIAGLLYARGLARFYATSPAAAIDDLVSAIQQDQPNDSKILEVIWLHLARVRSGQDDQDEFERNTNDLLESKWPAPILALYRDKGTADDVFSKAKTGTADEQADQVCDANFYIAEFYLSRNMKLEAKPLFQAATSTCSKKDLERSFAITELLALDGSNASPVHAAPTVPQTPKH